MEEYVRAAWGIRHKSDSLGGSFTQMNIYIVKAIELINRVTDKVEFISMCH